jgi:hypothetical protein
MSGILIDGKLIGEISGIIGYSYLKPKPEFDFDFPLILIFDDQHDERFGCIPCIENNCRAPPKSCCVKVDSEELYRLIESQCDSNNTLNIYAEFWPNWSPLGNFRRSGLDTIRETVSKIMLDKNDINGFPILVNNNMANDINCYKCLKRINLNDRYLDIHGKNVHQKCYDRLKLHGTDARMSTSLEFMYNYTLKEQLESFPSIIQNYKGVQTIDNASSAGYIALGNINIESLLYGFSIYYNLGIQHFTSENLQTIEQFLIQQGRPSLIASLRKIGMSIDTYRNILYFLYGSIINEFSYTSNYNPATKYVDIINKTAVGFQPTLNIERFVECLFNILSLYSNHSVLLKEISRTNRNINFGGRSLTDADLWKDIYQSMIVMQGYLGTLSNNMLMDHVNFVKGVQGAKFPELMHIYMFSHVLDIYALTRMFKLNQDSVLNVLYHGQAHGSSIKNTLIHLFGFYKEEDSKNIPLGNATKCVKLTELIDLDADINAKKELRKNVRMDLSEFLRKKVYREGREHYEFRMVSDRFDWDATMKSCYPGINFTDTFGGNYVFLEFFNSDRHTILGYIQLTLQTNLTDESMNDYIVRDDKIIQKTVNKISNLCLKNSKDSERLLTHLMKNIIPYLNDFPTVFYILKSTPSSFRDVLKKIGFKKIKNDLNDNKAYDWIGMEYVDYLRIPYNMPPSPSSPLADQYRDDAGNEYKFFEINDIAEQEPFWSAAMQHCFSESMNIDKTGITLAFVNLSSEQIVSYVTVYINIDQNWGTGPRCGFLKNGNRVHRNVNSIWNVCSTNVEKGACTKMMTHLVRDFLPKINNLPAILYVLKNNAKAIRCYLGSGFKKVNTDSNDDPSCDSYPMEYIRKYTDSPLGTASSSSPLVAAVAAASSSSSSSSSPLVAAVAAASSSSSSPSFSPYQSPRESYKASRRYGLNVYYENLQTGETGPIINVVDHIIIGNSSSLAQLVIPSLPLEIYASLQYNERSDYYEIHEVNGRSVRLDPAVDVTYPLYGPENVLHFVWDAFPFLMGRKKKSKHIKKSLKKKNVKTKKSLKKK